MEKREAAAGKAAAGKAAAGKAAASKAAAGETAVDKAEGRAAAGEAAKAEAEAGKAAAGCVHIYCGDGKGKTTAALGLALRNAGRGGRVLIARFLKTDDSGEIPTLRSVPGITVKPCEKTFGFYRSMTDKQKKEAADYYGNLLDTAWAEVCEGRYDLLILDEILAACNYGLVQEERLIQYLKERPESLEVVLTGRGPSDRLLETADYVSEIQKRKHPYDRGLEARRGIEY